jgi:dTDP-4-amino-4,6-dideoxygalactose transaminase
MNAHQERAYASSSPQEHSENARDSVILLPLFNEMTEGEVDKVVKGVNRVGKHHKKITGANEL